MKILVISLAGNGDTLFATPLIHELRANFPDATIDALVLLARLEGFARKQSASQYRVHQKNLIAESKTGSLKFLSRLRRAGYDVSINTFPQSRRHYRLVAKFINAPVRISHEYECSGALDRWLANKSIPQDYSRHAVENNLSLLSPLNVKVKLAQHRYEIFLTDAEKAWAENFVAREKICNATAARHPRRFGWHKKSRIAPLAAGKLHETGSPPAKRRAGTGHFVFWRAGGKSGLRENPSPAGGENLFFPKTENLRQAAALIGKCDLFLSVDTALMHLAAAMKVRGQVVIETPTWNKPIEPYANPFTLVKNPAVAGRNLDFYRYDGGKIKGTNEELLRCMASVTVDAVQSSVEKALRGNI